jgi:hypothetical protein
MTEQQPRPDAAQDPTGQDPTGQDPAGQDPTGADDLGGPAAALGTGVEEALTGTQPTEDDEGGASSSPQPRG